MALAVAWLMIPALPNAAEAESATRRRNLVLPTEVAALPEPAGGGREALILGAPPAQQAQTGWRATPSDETLDTVRLAIEDATRATGLSGGMLRRIAERESRLNPMARSRSSSATGLMQFTRDTWLEAVRDFGARHGLESEAAALQTDREGRIATRDPQTLRHILLLRENARYSAVLAAERLRAARPGLERLLGREATPADLYLVHLLGHTGSRRFLTALRSNPRQTSYEALGESAQANPSVFARNGESLPVARAYAELARMFEGPFLVAALSWSHAD